MNEGVNACYEGREEEKGEGEEGKGRHGVGYRGRIRGKKKCMRERRMFMNRGEGRR